MLSSGVLHVLSPVTCCVSVELLYFAHHFYRERHRSTSSQHGTVGHMVNSDTNVKYVIVHNISFILLFVVGDELGSQQ